MFNAEISLTTGSGKKDVVGAMESLAREALPTTADLLYAGQRQRARILERTEEGKDYLGQTFHPYSTNGPVYYYPSKDAKNRKAGKNRFAKQLGIPTKKEIAKEGFTARRTSLGIKFSSYAALKYFLGRSNVDLRGVSAPHMLQAMIVKVGGFVLGEVNANTVASPNTEGDRSNASELIIGIYGEEAERASGHNEGNPKKKLPKRRFLDASESDKSLVLSDIIARVAARARKALGGI